MKFHFNSFNGCQVTERTRNSIANNQMEITPKVSKAETVMVLVHDTLSHCALQVYEVSSNSFNSVQLTDMKLHLLTLQGG